MNVYQLLDQVTVKGGAIVSSGDCSEMEISDARANGRFAVMDDGIGFVRRTKEWLDLQLAREKAHPNTDGKYSQVNVRCAPTGAIEGMAELKLKGLWPVGASRLVLLVIRILEEAPPALGTSAQAYRLIPIGATSDQSK